MKRVMSFQFGSALALTHVAALNSRHIKNQKNKNSGTADEIFNVSDDTQGCGSCLSACCLCCLRGNCDLTQQSHEYIRACIHAGEDDLQLSMFVFVITGIIFVVVFTLLVYSVVKFRGRAGDAGREPAQVYGSTQIELAWTIIPVLIVVVLFLATARVIHAIQDAPKPAARWTVTVDWASILVGVSLSEARHRHRQRTAHSGERSRSSHATFLKLLSADTDHSFWVPELGRQDRPDSEPPEQNVDGPAAPRNFSWPVRAVLRNAARQDAAPRVRWMDLRILPPGSAPSSRPAVEDASAIAGRRVFETNACMNCHAVSGTAADGRFGPDLTHLMSRSHDRFGCGRKYAAKSPPLDPGPQTQSSPGR